MNLETFRKSLADDAAPAGLSLAVQALWHAAKGDWDTAHELAQEQEDVAGSWVHAYLHRQEGDLANAGYWYRRARKPEERGPLEAEWEAIARALLGE
jgi:hypothetical protein